MIESIKNDAAGWSGLQTVEMPIFRSLVVCEEPSGRRVMLTTESVNGRSRLEATFLSVVDLALSWPEYPNPIHLDVIDVSDVTAHGLENINFRVTEGAGFFKFSCRDFFAVVIREI